ncbi:MAG: lmo0937 family membrane protein [Candidatus Gracilibacteria bacterium]|nr:lmo0937 family membrane protein [Candidatus Gracilibacteria bacterium]
MLETIAIILIILWVLGLVSSYTIGGFIHILLVIAIILFLVRLINNK